MRLAHINCRCSIVWKDEAETLTFQELVEMVGHDEANRLIGLKECTAVDLAEMHLGVVEAERILANHR